MNRGWIGILVIAMVWTCGCHQTFERESRSDKDPFSGETESMRKEVRRVRPKQESEGKVIYGGLSSEAQSIEESLYGE